MTEHSKYIHALYHFSDTSVKSPNFAMLSPNKLWHYHLNEELTKTPNKCIIPHQTPEARPTLSRDTQSMAIDTVSMVIDYLHFCKIPSRINNTQ